MVCTFEMCTPKACASNWFQSDLTKRKALIKQNMSTHDCACSLLGYKLYWHISSLILAEQVCAALLNILIAMAPFSLKVAILLSAIRWF